MATLDLPATPRAPARRDGVREGGRGPRPLATLAPFVKGRLLEACVQTVIADEPSPSSSGDAARGGGRARLSGPADLAQ